MNHLTIEDVLFIHDYILEQSGGLAGLRDKGLLESAINKPSMTAFGIERHRTLFTKAAAILEAIALFHPFNDGNKRTAMAAASFFLYLNGKQMTFSNEEYEEFMLHVVKTKPPIKDIADWIEEHTGERGN